MKHTIKTFTCMLVFLFAANFSYAQKKKAKSESKSSAFEYQGPYCNGLARVKKDHKWGYVDTVGNIIIPIKYQQVENFSEGIARVRLGSKWGLMDNTGREIIKPTFVFIGEFINGKARVLLEGEEYYMNKE
ncbi:MAG TPA: WG repeat-containing protein, partial [Bacteroidia bacterium]